MLLAQIVSHYSSETESSSDNEEAEKDEKSTKKSKKDDEDDDEDDQEGGIHLLEVVSWFLKPPLLCFVSHD